MAKLMWSVEGQLDNPRFKGSYYGTSSAVCNVVAKDIVEAVNYAAEYGYKDISAARFVSLCKDDLREGIQ